MDLHGIVRTAKSDIVFTGTLQAEDGDFYAKYDLSGLPKRTGRPGRLTTTGKRSSSSSVKVRFISM